MGILKLENSQASYTHSVESKKSRSGKVTGAILGAALSGMHFSEINRDGNFLKLIKNYQKGKGFHPIGAFALAATIITAPLVAIGATLDGVIDAMREENLDRINQQKKRQIDVIA